MVSTAVSRTAVGSQGDEGGIRHACCAGRQLSTWTKVINCDVAFYSLRVLPKVEAEYNALAPYEFVFTKFVLLFFVGFSLTRCD